MTGQDTARAAAIRVQVTDDLVARFAALTGDHSSLHVSGAFARRSAYRRTVAHGMLPVAFVAVLPDLHVDGRQAVPVALNGRFVAPVYPGDSVTVSVSRSPASHPDQATFEYRVSAATTGKLLTDGSLTVRYEAAPVAPIHTSTSGPLVAGRLDMQAARLEDMQAGVQDSFAFHVTDDVLAEFAELLQSGVAAPCEDPRARIYLPNLLGVLLYSTSVGVLNPGSTATFLEFSAHLEGRLTPGVTYQLRATVSHRSKATRIVKKDMVIALADGSDVVVRGKVAVLVNPAFRSMPSMAELKASAMDLGLAGKVVLITGASRGIGETTAKLFALHGARVVVNYHRGAADAERVVREITEAGGAACALGADVASPSAVDALVADTLERYGAIDVLVNNAARDFRPASFLSLAWEDVQADLDVIVKGAFYCCQRVIPQMLRQGGGRIINISTIATDTPPPDQAKYVIAKSALVGLSRSLAVEFASRNIQVNLVVPSFVETDLVAHVQEGFRAKIASDTPMRRLASPIDVAQAVVMLASSFSSFTTGQRFLVTGGGAPYL